MIDDLIAYARRLHDGAVYKSRGQAYLRLKAAWAAPTWARNQIQPSHRSGEIFRLSALNSKRYILTEGPYGAASVPVGSRADAEADGPLALMDWERVEHILTQSAVIEAPYDLTTLGVDQQLAPEILAILLTQGTVTLQQVAEVHDEILTMKRPALDDVLAKAWNDPSRPNPKASP